jgi:hypothetical protein
MSEEAAASASSVAPAETYSADYVAQLKAELKAKAESEAALKSKYATYENKQRAQLAEMQPTVQEWIKEGLESGPEFKADMESMVGFGDSLANATNIDSAMPLARMISCHSAKMKRERSEFSAASGATEALGKANKELDEIRADRDAKATRITELEGLVAERTGTAERLQEELAKAGLVKEKFDFSNASSREAAPSSGASSLVAAAPAKATAPFVDPLFSFIQQSGAAVSGRIGQSNTGHHLLGANGSGEMGLAAAIQMA